ncbi:6-bladed beta-propeller [Cyclobacterium lianum]|nr:6-bladed beta-propeller [Cyclobacterium lianum]
MKASYRPDRIKKISILLIIILTPGWIFFQCQTRPADSDPGASILLDESSLFAFDDCVSEVEFISLESPKDTLINLSCSIYELVISDKLYYASRCHNDLSIHSFDWKGHYIRSWNRKGDGPEEYPALHGLLVEKDQMYINTGRGRVIKYVLPEFEFLQQIPIGDFDFVPSISMITPEKFLISTEHTGQETEQIFHIVDLQSAKANTLPVLSLPYSGELNPGMLAKTEDGHLLNFGLSDSIYQYRDGALSVLASLDFGERSIDPADFELEGGVFIEKVLLSQDYAFNTGHIATSGEIFKIMAYGIKRSPEFDSDNLTTFPFYDVYIHPESGKKKI